MTTRRLLIMNHITGLRGFSICIAEIGRVENRLMPPPSEPCVWFCEFLFRKNPASYLTLDDRIVLAAAKRYPTGFIAGLSGPVVMDEFCAPSSCFSSSRPLWIVIVIRGDFCLPGRPMRPPPNPSGFAGRTLAPRERDQERCKGYRFRGYRHQALL